ncbi:flagellar hook-length control protein FliK [Clostridium lundense]|uniref:flagellar hook-length control protein FliK n=1 Tax=Clostridium lundense TaxID=319475 RepID=UPI0004888FB9|nr:flagellar hook-length control protein FliK [Clostridium lundense]
MNNDIGMILGDSYANNSTSQSLNVSQNNSQNNNGEFTKVLKNTFTKKSSVKTLNSKSNNECDSTSKQDKVSSNQGNNDKSLKATKDDEKIRNLLRKAGVPEEKIEKIEVNDLAKLNQLLSSENINLDNLNCKDLISLLQLLINSNNNLHEENLLGQISELIDNSISNAYLDTTNKKVDTKELVNGIKDKLNSLFTSKVTDKLSNEQNIPLVKELVNSLQEKLASAVEVKVQENSSLPKEEIIGEIKKEILKMAEVDNKGLKTAISKDEQPIITPESIEKVTISEDKNSNNKGNEQLKDNRPSAEEKILKSISEDDKKDKFSKAVNFINHFNSLNKTQDAELVSAEKLVVNKDTIVSDVIKAVKYMDINNSKNLIVKINPKELGEIVINVTMENGKMKANITANNKEAFNLLNANISDINDKLQNSNIKIQNFSLSLYEDTTFFKDKEQRGQGSRNNRGNENKNNVIDDVEEVSENNISNDIRNLNIFA